MDKYIIYGKNIISKLLKKSLGEKGYSVVELDNTALIKSLTTELQNKNEKVKAIIDTTNSLVKTSAEDETHFVHNTSELTVLIDLASTINCPLLFLYRDSADLKPEASLFTAIDIIDKYGAQHNVKIAKVIMEDIYGKNINTSDRLKSFIDSLIGGYPLVVVNDNNDHYLFHESDFVEGIIEITDYINTGASYKTFTLFPEEPIIEIELAHFINSLSELPQEIEYSTDEHETVGEVSIEVNYPGKWYPEHYLEEGLIDTLRSMGVPIPADALRELENEREQYFKDYYNTKSATSDNVIDTPETNNTASWDDDTDNPIHDSAQKTSSHDDKDIHPLPDPFSKSDLDFDKYYNDDLNGDITPNKSVDELSMYNNPRESVNDNYGFDENTYLYDNDISSHDTSGGKNPYWLVAILGFLLIGILMIPSGLYVKDLYAGINDLYSSAESLKNFEFASANESSKSAQNHFTKLGEKKTPYPVIIFAQIANTEKNDISEIVNTLETSSNTINYLSLLGLESQSELADSGESGKVLGISNTYDSSNYLNKTLELIEKLESNKSKTSIENETLRNKLNDIVNPIIESKEGIMKLKTISPVMGTLVGDMTPQKYLLILQDTTETRGSGGVIELYGILNISNGSVEIIKVADSQEVDNQILLNDISINPPKIIEDLFRTDKLLFSDASWDPDFPTSAWQIKDLYEMGTTEEVNGVISINQNFLKSLVLQYGEVELTNFSETVSSDNFDSLIEKYSAETRTVYITFLKELTLKTLNKAISSQSGNELIKSIYNSLNSKDILIYHEDNQLQSSLMQNNWGGSILGNYDDYIYVVDSNISQNKVNQNISRKISYEGINPNEGKYVRRIIVTYTNNNESMPINRYINHMRLYVPKDAGLNSAFMISNTEKKLITRNIDVGSSGGKSIYSTEIIVDPQNQVSILFEFETPIKSYDDGKIDLVVQKQPGRLNDELDIIYNYPLGLPNNIKIDNKAKIETDNVIFDTDTQFDRYFYFPL